MSVAAGPAEGAAPSGEWYDWTRTRAPERPWIHDYSRTLVYKIFLASKRPDGKATGKVFLDFDGALEVMRRMDEVTAKVPKIAYLVGWQHFGHDSGYPAWDRVCEDLRSPADATALESLRRLIREGRNHHTTASLHVNMIDAYQASPLWEEYLAAGAIISDEDGRPIPGEVFDGERSFQVSYAREWEMGLAERRIRGLLEMIPELAEAGTIHVDAFHSLQPARRRSIGGRPEAVNNPARGTTVAEEATAQRRIIRLFRDLGLDLTAEGAIDDLRIDPFIGLQPMAWHFHPSIFRFRRWLGKPSGFRGLPPSLYCGTPMKCEPEIKRDPVGLPGLARRFRREVLPWLDRNAAGEARLGLGPRGHAERFPAAPGRGERDRYKGLTFWSPDINIYRDPRWGRRQGT